MLRQPKHLKKTIRKSHVHNNQIITDREITIKTCNNLIYHPFRISFQITFENIIINLSGAIYPKVQPLDASHLWFWQNKNLVLQMTWLQYILLNKLEICTQGKCDQMWFFMEILYIPLVKLRGDCPSENETLEFGVHRDWMLYMKRSETIPASR